MKVEALSLVSSSEHWVPFAGWMRRLSVFAKVPVTELLSINTSLLPFQPQVNIPSPDHFSKVGQWRVCVASLRMTVVT